MKLPRFIDDLQVPVEVVHPADNQGGPAARSWHLSCPVCEKRHLPGKHDQSTHGRGKGMRASLKGCKTVADVDGIVAAEASAIAKREVSCDMAGSDLQVAKEHGEAVLRGFERHPHVQIGHVSTYGPGGSDSFPSHEHAYALTHYSTSYGPTGRHYDTISFNNHYAADPGAYRGSLQRDVASGFHPKGSGGPIGVASHEVGHSLSHHNGGDRRAAEVSGATARTSGKSVKDVVSSRVSRYATESPAELAAEAYADVAMNGARASSLSRDIMASVEVGYHNNNDYLDTWAGER